MSRANGIVFEKGWHIVCPQCALHIAECLVDQFPHHPIIAEDFKSLGEWDMLGPMNCPGCSTQYMRALGEAPHGVNGQIFSNHGWQPDIGEE